MGLGRNGKDKETTSREGDLDRNLGSLDTGNHSRATRERGGWPETDQLRGVTTREGEGRNGCQYGLLAGRGQHRARCPGFAEPPSAVAPARAVDTDAATPTEGPSADDGGTRVVSEMENSRRCSDALLRPVGVSSQQVLDDGDHGDRRRRRRRQEGVDDDGGSLDDRTSCSSGAGPMLMTSAGGHSGDVPEWSPAPTASSDEGGFDDGVTDAGIIAINSSRIGGSVPIRPHRHNLVIGLKATVRAGQSVPTTRRDCGNLGSDFKATEVDLHSVRGSAVNRSAADGAQATITWLNDSPSRGHVHAHPYQPPRHHHHQHHH